MKKKVVQKEPRNRSPICVGRNPPSGIKKTQGDQTTNKAIEGSKSSLKNSVCSTSEGQKGTGRNGEKLKRSITVTERRKEPEDGETKK